MTRGDMKNFEVQKGTLQTNLYVSFELGGSNVFQLISQKDGLSVKGHRLVERLQFPPATVPPPLPVHPITNAGTVILE